MNKQSLGGVVFCIDAIKYDYCIEQSIECLKELVDELVILDAGSDDGTQALLEKYTDEKTQLILLDRAEWEKQKGREKLAYFQNMALSFLSTDWYFLLQADEIITEESFPYIREAINHPYRDSYLCERVNLWGDCNHFINVPINKQPCSIAVNRLARTSKKSHGDGESIEAIASLEFINKIMIIHYGFVRKREVMKSKIINMQEGVFQITHDPKLDQGDVFDSELWFKGKELSPIKFKHPKWVKKWVQERP